MKKKKYLMYSRTYLTNMKEKKPSTYYNTMKNTKEEKIKNGFSFGLFGI